MCDVRGRSGDLDLDQGRLAEARANLAAAGLEGTVELRHEDAAAALTGAAVDSVISHAEEVADLRTPITADRRVNEALVPTGAGVLLLTRLLRPAGQPDEFAVMAA